MHLIELYSAGMVLGEYHIGAIITALRGLQRPEASDPSIQANQAAANRFLHLFGNK